MYECTIDNPFAELLLIWIPKQFSRIRIDLHQRVGSASLNQKLAMFIQVCLYKGRIAWKFLLPFYNSNIEVSPIEIVPPLDTTILFVANILANDQRAGAHIQIFIWGGVSMLWTD